MTSTIVVALAFATAVAIPMRSPDRSLGVLGLLWDHEVPRLTAPAMEVAEAFAAQAGVTLMLADALRGHEQLMVLRERDRIARDMHDLVVQRVFATGMSLQSALRTGDVPDRVRGRIERAIDDLDETITEIRRTIFDLRHEEPAPTPVLTRFQREASQAAVLLGFAPEQMRPTALALNLLVGAIGLYRFWRGGHVRWRNILPFVLASAPAAYFAARVKLPADTYSTLLAVVLIVAGVVFLLINFNLISFRCLIRWWRAGLIALGAFLLWERLNTNCSAGGSNNA